MERESQMIQTNIQKIEKDPKGDQAKAKRLKSVLSQCNGDISKVILVHMFRKFICYTYLATRKLIQNK